MNYFEKKAAEITGGLDGFPCTPEPAKSVSCEIIEVDDHAESFERLGVEALIDVGGWTFVLTPSKGRAAMWCSKVGHVGITPEEVTALGRAVGGPIGRELLLKIAAVKRTFPGAHVLQALKIEPEQNELPGTQGERDGSQD